MAITDNYAPDKSSGNGVTTAFSGNWNVLSSDYFRLYWEDKTTGVQTLKTLGTHYTLAFTASGYTATHDALYVPPSTVWVIRSREITKDQSVPFKTASGWQGGVVENALDKLTAMDQEVQDQLDRAVKFPLGSSYSDPVYGDAPVDGFGIVWDGANGRFRNTTVSMTDLEASAALIAGIETDIVTVAGIAADVTEVSSIHTAVSNVSSISSAVSNVSGISTAVSNVNTIRANVTTVAGIQANVTTVAGVASGVATLSPISANITTVAGVSANVTTVAGNIGNVNTVAGISANVTTVAGISANVTTVAGDHTSIVAVAADLTKIDGVYADITKIDGVYGDLTKIDGVYADLTKIDGVYADLTNIDAVYAALTNINTVAGISSAVSTVSTNIASVNTCATNIAAIIDAPNQAAAAAASAASAAASASGISMRGSCRACATGALTVTYANGVLGVGATLTNAGAQAAFAADGVTLAVGERVLIPSQASALQNGMYTLTVAGSGATNWVLTRATDYDEASEIVEGTATIIEEGTVNASHIYVMTHHGAITVGTTAIDFTALTAVATSANTLTTPRAIYGNNFDGSAALTQIIASTYGGTGNGFTKFSGPTTSERTKTVRDASDTILELGGSYTPSGTWTSLTMVTPVLGTPTSGTLTNCTGYTDANVSFTDITTNNASTTKHGFLPKLDNTVTHFLNGQGGWTTPPATTLSLPRTTQTSTYAPTTTDNASEISFSGAGADATWTIAAGATNGAGWYAIFNNPTSFNLTIKVTTNTIDGIAGATGFVMYPGEVRLVQCNGTNYFTTIIHGFAINTTSTFTFVLPPGYAAIDVMLWGGGGSGGKGATNGGGGGGGGFCASAVLPVAGFGAINSSTTITIGAGGTGQASANTAGNAGGTSSIGSLLNAYGGGRGGGSSLGAGGGGGGAGLLTGNTGSISWTSGVGGNATTTTAGTGGVSWNQTTGAVASTTSGDVNSGGGGGGTGSAGGNGYYGGGGGGPSIATTGGAGGCSVFGGGGGGGASNTTGGPAGTSLNGGSGSAGQSGSNSSSNGTAPAGGSGGVVTGTSGNGGSGQVIMIGVPNA